MGLDRDFNVLSYKLYYNNTYSFPKLGLKIWKRLKILQTGFYITYSDLDYVEFHIRKF